MPTPDTYSAKVAARLTELATNDAKHTAYRTVLDEALATLQHDLSSDATNAVRTSAKAYALQLLEDAQSGQDMKTIAAEAAGIFKRAQTAVGDIPIPEQDITMLAQLRQQTLETLTDSLSATRAIIDGGGLEATRKQLLKPSSARSGNGIGGSESAAIG